ncbi:uncharacterized protein BO97DRAFT_115838 [Aspergillus homomorphus CBS 101889]|uniref:Pentatricopeptide repeat protein n=1 Tax=Aspergillus homomorphus (strain CBS 101889) TaxID=1450537 RepID=A0A395HSH2_ASPHC|nr:hypothetical protein BO97DRAFT_115838 [Aspergillus homomorphus CBS 101889]RAL10901.1 hypothetical protein BO97DRAFT_115838 [Aspergillus homomorphus CBS 101889]
MLSRSRPYLTRRRISAALEHVATAPDEPLLFLYPSWFTSILTHRRSFSATNPAPNPLRQRSRPGKRGPNAPRLPPGPSTGNSSRQLSASSPTAAARHTSKKTATETTAEPQAARRPSSHRPRPDGSSKWEGSQLRGLIALPSTSPRDKKKLLHRYIKPRTDVSERQKERKEQGAVFERLLRMDRVMPATVPLKPDQLEVHVREDTIAAVAGMVSKGENIFYRYVYHGCRVHVLPPSESVGLYRRVILEGTAASVEDVKNELLETRTLQDESDPVVDMPKPSVPIYPSVDRRKHKDIPLIRGAWDMRQRITEFTVEQIAQQGELIASVRDFTHHVEDLITARPKSRAKPAQHAADVADALEELFLKSASRKFMSTAALSQALSFLVRCKQYWIALSIFHNTRHVATVETFNIMLKSTALEQNPKRFRQSLHVMEKLGIRPDVETWLAFADTFIYPAAKMAVVKSLRQRGMLKETTRARTALRLVVHELLVDHLQDGGDMDSFLQMIARDYDSAWWSPSLVNQMMCAIIHAKNWKARDQLFRFCRQNGIHIEPYTFLLLVGSCNKGNIIQALRYLYQTMDDPMRDLDMSGWTRLFLHAWHGGYYNICRVLWRYACMRGHVSRRITDKVYESLLHEAGPETTFRKAIAARVILGIDLGPSRPAQAAKSVGFRGLPAEYAQDPMKYLCVKVDPQGRNSQLSVSEAIMLRDQRVAQSYKPHIPLHTMLEAAAIVDLEWKALARKAPLDLGWMQDHIISVEVLPKTNKKKQQWR